jgi:hypothetical protein
VTDCAVWSKVVSKVLGPPGAERDQAVQRIICAQRELSRAPAAARAIREAAAPRLAPGSALLTMREATTSLCHIFASVTQAHVIVDTSKRAIDAATLSSVDAIQQYVVHIVRDPRAVVHSWRHAKSFEVDGRTYTMGTRRLPGALRRWWWSAITVDMLRRRIDPSRWLCVRYEDFCRDPQRVVAQVLTLLDESPSGSPFVDSHTVVLHESHMVAGNPSRFVTGPVTICVDDRWRSSMSRRDQRLIALVARPLMRRFKYDVG